MSLWKMFLIMQTMGKKKPRPRRLFMREFKAEIVELCQCGERSVGQVAKDFDLTETAVRAWVELARLRRENRRLAEGVEILKRATAFFAKKIR
ncbi:transposase [Amycolatopsis sp. NPDC051061]|uniref:transposase n=1 Tax=Amycolatopsis sp. NPDC051061 TaxID=3155042 RepID=UPI00343DCDA6